MAGREVLPAIRFSRGLSRHSLESLKCGKDLRDRGTAGTHEASFQSGDGGLVHGGLPRQPLPRKACKPASSHNERGQVQSDPDARGTYPSHFVIFPMKRSATG